MTHAADLAREREIRAAPMAQAGNDPEPSSARAHTFIDLCRMSEDEVSALFAETKWGSNLTCPRCQERKIYVTRTRPGYKCRAGHKFTVTSDSWLASRKMSLRTAAVIIYWMAANPKGRAALQIAKETGLNQRSAHYFCRNVRKAMFLEQDKMVLHGDIEIDGAMFGGHNLTWFDSAGRKRRKWNYTNRQVCTCARERRPFGRTICCITKKESESAFYFNARMDPDCRIFIDGTSTWQSLSELREVFRVNHKLTFVDGECSTNLAESFHALIRRKQKGVHHRMAGKYLHLYAAEMAWQQNNRHLSPWERFIALLSLVLCDQPVDDATATIISPSTSDGWSIRPPTLGRLRAGR